MQTVTREDLQKIFKKEKHLRISEDLETTNFDELKYYSWVDQTDKDLYMVYSRKGVLDGIRFEMTQIQNTGVKLGFCTICKKQKPLGEIMLLTAKTRFRPDGIDFRVRGNYVCTDSAECNHDMEDEEGVEALFASICDDTDAK
jgi:hypothetical protein